MTTTHFDALSDTHDGVGSVSDEDVAAGLLVESRQFMLVGLAGTAVFWLFLFGSRADGTIGMALAMAGHVAAMGGTVLGVSRGARGLGLSFVLRLGLLVMAFMPLVNLVPLAYFLGSTRSASASSAQTQARRAHVEAARARAKGRRQAAATESGRRRPDPSRTAEAKAMSTAPQPISIGRHVQAVQAVRGDDDTPTQRQDLPELEWPGQASQVKPAAPAEAVQDHKALAVARLRGALPRIYFVDAIDAPDGTLIKALPSEGPHSDPAMADVLSLPVIRVSHGVFGVAYMVDEGTHYMSVSRDDLETAGITADRLHQWAMSNLGQKLAQKSPGLRATAYGDATRLIMDGETESSLVLVDQLWDKSIRRSVEGDLCVAIPTRDTCVYCSVDDTDGLESLQQVLQHHQQVQSRGAVSPRLLWRLGGRWSVTRGLPPTSSEVERVLH